MNELIKITTNENGEKLVSVRELYKGLGLQRTNIKNWIKINVLENEFFLENESWVGCIVNIQGNETTDYAISLEFAKHLAMQARTENSHKYRNYFIECEKVALTITEKDRLLLGLFSDDKMVVAESHKQLVDIEVKEATKELTAKIEEDKPLVTFSNTILKSSDNILVRELSKVAYEQGMNIGEKKLYKKLREWNYIMQNSTEPYQSALNQGLFVLQESSFTTPYGVVRITKTTKVTPKGQVFIIEKLKKELLG